MLAPRMFSHHPWARLALVLIAATTGCRFSSDRELGAGEIRGRVLADSVNGAFAPVAGAEVKLAGSTRKLKTDAQGRFLIRPLAAGEYGLSLTYTLEGKSAPDAILGLAKLKLEPQSGLDLGNLRLAVAGSIAGRVMLDGNPVPNAALTVLDADGNVMPGVPVARSDGNGRYVIPYAVAGQAQVQALFEMTVDTTRQVFTAKSQQVTIAPRTLSQVDLSLSSPVPAELGTVTGAATYTETVGDVSATLTDDEGNTFAAGHQSADHFVVENVPAGVYTLTVTAEGLEPIVEENVIVNGLTTVGMLVFSQKNGQPFDCNGDGVIACSSVTGPSCDRDDDGDGFDDSTEDPACLCRPGAAKDPMSGKCVAPNPCAATNVSCDANATCLNHAGRALCQCNMGYKGDGVSCMKAASCQEENGGCDAAHGLCTLDNDQIRCACAKGYDGDGKSCRDTDECKQQPGLCDPNSTCTNSDGAYSCACKAGYSGDGASCTDDLPVISALDVSPRFVGLVGTPVDVTFQVSERIDLLGMTVEINSFPTNCVETAASPYTYTCSYTTTGLEVMSGTQSTVLVNVKVFDGVNTVTDGTSMTFDFAAPQFTAKVTYSPDRSNPLATPTLATSGTWVTIELTADEDLDSKTSPTILVTAPGVQTPLAFTEVAGSLSARTISFEYRVNSEDVDGTYDVTVNATDTFGHNGDRDLGGIVGLQLSAPTFSVDQSKVQFLRSPNGSATRQTLGGLTIPDGPLAAITSPTLGEIDQNAFSFGSAPARLVRVGLIGRQLQSALATIDSGTGSTWPIQWLPPQTADESRIVVWGVDSAGNESDAVVIEHVEWIGTTNVSSGYSHDGEWYSTVAHEPVREQDYRWRDSYLNSDFSTVTGPGLAPKIARAQPTWRNLTGSSDSPSVAYAAMAWDTGRGNLLLFGGTGIESDVGDTWEWHDGSWESRYTFQAPSARHGHAMVYDGARGRPVLFGGSSDGSPQNDLWEWGPYGWDYIWISGQVPAARFGHAMVYDMARRVTVLFGGDNGGSALDDTWEWNGTAWTDVTPAAGSPTPRSGHAMAYDPVRKKTVLFGGVNQQGTELSDVWEWDGTAWQNVTTLPAATGRFNHGMAYDTARHVTLIFGGERSDGTILTDLLKWDGTASQSVTAAGEIPEQIGGRTVAYDLVAQRLLVVGGFTTVDWGNGPMNIYTDAFSAWDGTQWADLTPAGYQPYQRSRTSFAYDPVRKRTVLTDGEVDSDGSGEPTEDTWEWAGMKWVRPQMSTNAPNARFAATATFDGSSNQVVAIGGVTWGFDLVSEFVNFTGSAWGVLSTNAAATTRWGAGLAYDASRSRLVTFGGYAVSGTLNDTWEWDGTDWTKVSASAAPVIPAGLEGFSMEYFPPANKTVVFGGFDENGAYTPALWMWNGTTWTATPIPVPASGGIPARTGQMMAYDSTRQRLVIFGGDDGTYQLNDLWEWDGTSMMKRELPVGDAPMERKEGGFAYDASRQKLVLFGGDNSESRMGDTWELDVSNRATPSMTFDVWIPYFAAPDSVTGVSARAFCGGVAPALGASGDGAILSVWNTGDANHVTGWADVATNTTPLSATPPELSPAAPPLTWSTTTAEEAKAIIQARDGVISVGCRARGGSTTTTPAAVGTSHIEVHVKYTVPTTVLTDGDGGGTARQ